MAATIANLSVSVTARVRKFQKGMRTAQKSLLKFTKAVANAGKRFAQFGAVLAAGAVAGLVVVTKKAFTAIDSISKLSDSLGIATEDLVALQHASEITGVGTEAMNKALKKFVINIGEAQTGVSEALDTLEQLGLTAEQLALAGPAEAFKLVAEEINKLPDVTARAEASYRLFGRAGVALTNTLVLGREGLEQMKLESIALGLSFDRLAGAKIEAANDAITRLQGSFIAIGRQIAIVLSPFLRLVADRLTDIRLESLETSKGFINAFRSGVKSVGLMLDSLSRLQAEFILTRVELQKQLVELLTIESNKFILVLNAVLREFLGIEIKNPFKGMGLALKEEIESGTKAAAKLLDNFAKRDITNRILDAFDKINDEAAKLARAVRLGPEPIPALIAANAEALRAKNMITPGVSSLRSLSELGGIRGAKAVSSAVGKKNQELDELRKQTAQLQKLVAQGRGGGLVP